MVQHIRTFQGHTIDVAAHAVDGIQRGTADTYQPGDAVSADLHEEVSEAGRRSGSTPGGLGFSPYGQYGEPRNDAKETYDETFIGLHHNARGVRFVLQASPRNALIIIAIVLLLLSRPGFLDLGINLLRALAGAH